MNKITITLPDNNTLVVDEGTTGYQIAQGISQSLADQSVAVMLNNKMCDVSLPIKSDLPEAKKRSASRVRSTGDSFFSVEGSLKTSRFSKVCSAAISLSIRG